MNSIEEIPGERVNLEENKEMIQQLETITVPLIHEQVRVDKKIVETGKVRVSKHVHEYDELVNIPLLREEIDIEHVSINQFVDEAPPAVRYEEDTMIIPVLKEVSVVKILLVEEIRITKRQVQTQHTQNVRLRREEINVERVSANDVPLKTD